MCGGLAHNSLYIDALADVTGMLGDGADEFFHLCLFVFFFSFKFHDKFLIMSLNSHYF